MARNNQSKTLIPKKLQQWQPQTPLTGRARLGLWEKYRGIWKNKKPDPIKNEPKAFPRLQKNPKPQNPQDLIFKEFPPFSTQKIFFLGWEILFS